MTQTQGTSTKPARKLAERDMFRTGTGMLVVVICAARRSIYDAGKTTAWCGYLASPEGRINSRNRFGFATDEQVEIVGQYTGRLS
jgi:hypothetical protein